MIEAAVVDASVVVKWVLKEIGSERARLLSEAELSAPDLLPVECANVLWKKVLLGDLRPREAFTRLDLLLQAPVALLPSAEVLPAAIVLSVQLKHPVYECLYLALAARRTMTLVTADQGFARAVRRRKKLARLILTLDEL
jgi:predicted nucleic acid-binding protein